MKRLLLHVMPIPFLMVVLYIWISLDLAYAVPRLGVTVCLCSAPLLSLLKATGLRKSVGIVWTNRSQRLVELYIMVCLRSIS